MALTTFQGPVKSLKGFYAAGPGTVISLTADTTLTVADHAGKIMVTNDADGKFTLPTIDATADAGHTGPGPDVNNTNNVGSTYTFIVETAATDMDIKTDGTDKFIGGLYAGIIIAKFINLNKSFPCFPLFPQFGTLHSYQPKLGLWYS